MPGDEDLNPASEPAANGGKFDVLGGASVALLGYSVLRITCRKAGGDTFLLPTGFTPLCVLPALTGTCTVGTDSDSGKPTATISGATVGSVYFIIGQN